MQKSLGLCRLLAYSLLGLQITTAVATYTPPSSHAAQLEERGGLLSSLNPSTLTGLLQVFSSADPSEKLEIVEAMLNEAGLSGVLNETALTDVLSPGAGLSGAILNQTAITNSLLNGTTGVTKLASILESRDVYSPTITQPTGHTVWITGTTVKVKWNTHNAPKKITNDRGMIVLGYIEDGTDEHLDLDHPLADDFDIMQGEIDVEVPDVDPRNDYIIVLFGDSGNKSPQFTIN